MKAGSRPGLQSGVVALVALASSLPGLLNAFTYDDVPLIQDNVRLHSLSNWSDILLSAYWPAPWSQELYRPVMSLLLSFQYAVAGGSPVIFRLVSYLLYVFASLLVLRLGRRVVPATAAFVVAALFAAHPVHVEAVAPAVNQGELIVASLAMLSLILFLDRKRAGALRPQTWGMLMVMTAIAALTKENGFIIPGLILCADIVLDEDGPDHARPWARWRGYALLAVMCLLLLWMRSRVLAGDVVGTYTAEALVGVPFGTRLLTTLQVVPHWFRLMLWPAHLQIDYSPDELIASTRLGLMELAGLGLVVLAMVTALVMRRRAPVVTFALACAAIALLPVSNLLVTTSILLAERTLFLPSAFALIAAVAMVLALWPLEPLAQARLRSVSGVVVPALVLIGAFRSGARQMIWRNQVRLMHAASIEAPKSKRVQQARRDAAKALLDDFAPRIAASPEPWRVHREAAALLHVLGDDSLAVVQVRLMVTVHPDHRAASLELAELLVWLHRFNDARELARSEIARGDTAVAWRQLLLSADSGTRR